MSVEVLPVGVTCQLQCTYCYETSLRDANPVNRYNREKVIAAIHQLPDHWSLFGGEPLILPLKDVDELLTLGFKKWGYTSIQTNGALITEEHIKVFEKCNTGVGISLDGPDELNDTRWAGTLEATRKQTAKTHWAIKRLCEIGHVPSLIVTVHAGNCSAERFPKFRQWFKDLDAMGIRNVNLHLMELDAKAHEIYIGPQELADRLIDLWNDARSFKNLQFIQFGHVLRLLQGDDKDTVCTHHACDPLNTQAVQAVDNEGVPSLCGRVHKGGTNWLPAEGTGEQAALVGHPGNRFHERQLALYVTPQEHGGCKDCEYWLVCQGQCPGEGENNDWRYRTSYCEVWKRLYAEGAQRLRAVGLKPICDWPERKELEDHMYEIWVRGERTPHLTGVIEERKAFNRQGMVKVAGGYHGDSHGDC